MSPSPDPPADAVALFRTVLANPDDETPRLVFADWLEDTGVPANVAWAEYLRLHTAAGGRDPARAAALAPRIKARLTLSAWTFQRHCALVLALLPADCVTVRLAGYWPDHQVISAVPESVVRETLAMPLVDCNGRFVFAAPSVDPVTRERWTFILGRDVDFVHADADEVQSLINTCYGQTETETMDVSYESPAIVFELEWGTPPQESLSWIFFHAFSRQWTDLLVRRNSDLTTVEFQTMHLSTQPEPQPTEVYELLLAHLLSLPPVAEGVQSPGYSWRVLDVPMQSGRTLRWTLICDGVPPADWYLLRLSQDDWNHLAPYHFPRMDFDLL